jgi:hypothetical protein
VFVVRIIADAERVDFKAFDQLPGARQRLEQYRQYTDDGELDSIAIFEVPGATDPRAAVEAVKAGNSALLRLVDFHESRDIRIERLAQKLEFKL